MCKAQEAGNQGQGQYGLGGSPGVGREQCWTGSVSGSNTIPLATCWKRHKSREPSEEVTAVETRGDGSWAWGWGAEAGGRGGAKGMGLESIWKVEPTAFADRTWWREERSQRGLPALGLRRRRMEAGRKAWGVREAREAGGGPDPTAHGLREGSWHQCGLRFSPTSRGPLSSPPTSPPAGWSWPCLFPSLSSVL